MAIDGMTKRPHATRPVDTVAPPHQTAPEKPQPIAAPTAAEAAMAPAEATLPAASVEMPEVPAAAQMPAAVAYDLPRERTHQEIMVVMGALMLAMLLAVLDQSIVGTALPTIAKDLHGLNKISWVASSYLLTSAIVTPIYGKLGDLFGRKKIFQTAIVIFLLGSMLAGLSQTMNQLVFFRALQGIGGGGLMALVLAIIGDVIPPRQRGRYQGYFGGVIGVATVAGPLIGGYFTQHLSWRWIFYINVPLGIAALAVVAARLYLPKVRREHSIDYAGAALLALSVSSLLFVTIWAGVTYAWGSPQILGLFATAIVGTIAFVIREHYATEPIIPLKLFKNDIFNVSSLLSFLAGVAMFAAILYIPVYQQIVHGYSPTKSGLSMLPLVIGLFGASIVSGRLTSKYGKYRIFPIIGTLVLALGLYLFSHLSVDTNFWLMSSWMVVLGAGLGLFMQIPTLAVQNATDRSELGTATSTVTFFRSLGSALGGAVFGTILTSRLSHHLADLLPANPANALIAKAGLTGGTAALVHVTPMVRADVFQAFVLSFRDMFLFAVPFALAAFVVALFLREQPLRGSAQGYAEGAGIEPAAPAH